MRVRADEPEPGRLEHRGEVDAAASPPSPPRTWATFRVGPATSAVHPQMCAEVTPLAEVGLEACGTGAGFLYDDGAREIAHFRMKGRLGAVDVHPAGETLRVEPWVAGGFAEMQIADDAPGFDFAGTGPFGVETAGPEAGASVRVLYPVALGVELVGEEPGLVPLCAAPRRAAGPDPAAGEPERRHRILAAR